MRANVYILSLLVLLSEVHHTKICLGITTFYTIAEVFLNLIGQVKVMEIHARRKMAQMEAGRQLKELEGHWVAMVTNNYR